MHNKKRSPIAAIVLAVVIGLLVIALLNGVVRPTQVVVARVAVASGTVLSEALVELRTIPRGAVPAGVFKDVAEVEGKLLAVARAPGDLITESVLGDAAGAGIPGELPAGHVAMAIHVDAASAVAGLLRPGQTVSVIGMLSPDVLEAGRVSVYPLEIAEFTSPLLSLTPGVTPTPFPTATPVPPRSPLARVAITGVRVLMVPQSFRYEELPAASSQEELFSSAQTSLSVTEGSVIVLEVPTGLVELVPGFLVNPAALLAALDEYGMIILALEPASGLVLNDETAITLNLGELYDQLNTGQGE